MEVQGVGTKLVLTEYGVRVEPTSILGSKTIIEIPYEQITSINWKAPTLLGRGWIHFATASSPSGALSMPNLQPGAVIFRKQDLQDMEEAKALVQKRVNALRRTV